VFAHLRADYHGGEGGHKEEIKRLFFSSPHQVKRRCGKRGHFIQFVNSCSVIDDANGIVDDLTKNKKTGIILLWVYMPVLPCSLCFARGCSGEVMSLLLMIV
jgi:hypothetical protein